MEKCNLCGNTKEVISNKKNPFSQSICYHCVVNKIDVFNLLTFTYFCRNYGIPFDPNIYCNLSKEFSTLPHPMLFNYMHQINYEKIKDNEMDNWKLMSEEWEKVKRYDILLTKVDKLRESFLDRSRVKWGPSFTFEEYLKLDNIYMNVLKSYALTDPIKQDAVKKAAIMSVQLDRAQIEGNFKDLKEGYTAYQTMLNIADVKSFAELAKEDEINTVSDLFAYMEKTGFEFPFYQEASNDQVDFVIQNIQNVLTKVVQDATGFKEILTQQKENYENLHDDIMTEAALDEITTEEVEDFYSDMETMADQELEDEGFDWLDVDEY